MVKVHCRIPQKYLGRIDPTDTIITPHSPAGWLSDEEPSETSDQPTSEASENESKKIGQDSTQVAEAKPEVDSAVDAAAGSHSSGGTFIAPSLPPNPSFGNDPKLPLDDAN